jgi:hypothetical protein
LKNISIHSIIFCTVFFQSFDTQAGEIWENGLALHPRQANVELFDFDDYEARVASMDERDAKAEEEINRLLVPLDVPLRNRGNPYDLPGEEDAILQEILAESIRTARIEQENRAEQAQREFKAAAHEEKAVAQNLPVIASQPAEWEPLSGQIVRAGELIVELRQSKNGAYPTHEEMARQLVTGMGVTNAQAEKILDELGL